MANVTKKDMVEMISDATGLVQIDVKIAIEGFLEAVCKALREGKDVNLRRFGCFKIKEKKARIARNPHSNMPIVVPAGYKPVFKFGKKLCKSVKAQQTGIKFEENKS